VIGRIKFSIEPLVREIVDSIPDGVFASTTTTFLDPAMGGGQFLAEIVRRLQEHGHSASNIRARVQGWESNPLSVAWVENHREIPATVACKTLDHVVELGVTQQFDVILGNPPYQYTREDGTRADKAKNLWSRFVHSSLQMLKPDGYLAMVVPNSWLSPSADIGKGSSGTNFIRDWFTQGKLHAANIGECGRHFPAQNLAFSYFVYQNSPADRWATQVVTETERFTVDFRDCQYFPNRLSATNIQILNRVLFGGYQTWGFVSTNYRGMVKEFHPQGAYPVWHTSAKAGIRQSHTPSDNHHQHKVIVSSSSVYAPCYDAGTLSCSVMTMSCTFQDTVNLECVKSILSSKLYQWVMEQTIYGGWVSYEAVRRLPVLDYTRTWTDTEIYQYFGLTPQEITEVERWCYEPGKHPRLRD
jgi:site-specific DNA-methyltransferase (adenine-specific)